MASSKISANNPTSINFCGGKPKIKNKNLRALYHRKFGEFTPTRLNVYSGDSKFIKGLKNFANVLKYLFIDP